MELIASFQVDHTKIVPGIYVSRVDDVGGEKVTTFDIRMKRPNVEPALHPNSIHTIEHIVATYLRNDLQWKDRIVYFGPMGCLTGNYLIVKGTPTPKEICPLVIAAFESLRDWKSEVPGATAVNCGNYLLHDLPMAKWEATRFVDILRNAPSFDYPMAERIEVDAGVTFYDS